MGTKNPLALSIQHLFSIFFIFPRRNSSKFRADTPRLSFKIQSPHQNRARLTLKVNCLKFSTYYDVKHNSNSLTMGLLFKIHKLIE